MYYQNPNKQNKQYEIPAFTYEFADSRGWCVPGVCGVYNHWKYSGGDPDAECYILDKTAIFGPFDRTPYLEFEIPGTDLSFTTENLNFCDDYVERQINNIEEHEYHYDDSIVGLAAVRYEDGEVYVAVKFYKIVTDSSGNPITLVAEFNGELSEEDETRLHEERESGLRDYFLTAVSKNAHIILQYEEGHLSISDESWLYDTPLNDSAMLLLVADRISNFTQSLHRRSDPTVWAFLLFYNIVPSPLYYVRSGYANASLGRLEVAGINGYGWSSSAAILDSSTSAFSYNLRLTALEVRPSGGPDRRWIGFSLR